MNPVNDDLLNQIAVLMYHSVGDDPIPGLEMWQVTEESLAYVCEHLKRHEYRTATVNEMVAMTKGRQAKERLVALTFDDAYVDFAKNAWPILQSYGLRPILFVPTGHIGKAAVWDEEFGPPRPILEAEELARLAAEGVILGCHAHQHRHLDAVGSDEIALDLKQSIQKIEQLSGSTPKAFAYPFGTHDDRVVDVSRGVGFELAFGLKQGYLSGSTDPLRIPRLTIDNTYRPDPNDPILPLPW